MEVFRIVVSDTFFEANVIFFFLIAYPTCATLLL